MRSRSSTSLNWKNGDKKSWACSPARRGRLDQEEGLQDFQRQAQALPNLLTGAQGGPLEPQAALDLWNDARSTAELKKFKQVEREPPAVTTRPCSSSPPPQQQLMRRERANIALGVKRPRLCSRMLGKIAIATQLHQRTNSAVSGEARRQSGSRSPSARLPEKEWKKIMSFTYTGARRCPWFNCSLGCRFGDACRNKHVCVQCCDHPYHGNH